MSDPFEGHEENCSQYSEGCQCNKIQTLRARIAELEVELEHEKKFSKVRHEISKAKGVCIDALLEASQQSGWVHIAPSELDRIITETAASYMHYIDRAETIDFSIATAAEIQESIDGAFERYRNDYRFKFKVQGLVSAIMGNVMKPAPPEGE